MSGELASLRQIGPALVPARHTSSVAKVPSEAKPTPQSAAPAASAKVSPERLRLPSEKAMQVDTINQRLAQLAARADQRGQEVDIKV